MSSHISRFYISLNTVLFTSNEYLPNMICINILLNRRRNCTLLVLTAISLLFCTPANAQPVVKQKWHDPTPHTSSFIKVNGTTINYLDWGGTKPVLILTHGIGESPHIFDDLSYKLSGQFRLIAYARRGQGQSNVEGPYDIATAVNDLAKLMRQLKITKATLLARARGGNEITAFAQKFPEKVIGLIYLDAAYDWSDAAYATAFENLPVRITPVAENFRNMHTYGSFYHHLWLPGVKWTDGLSSHVQNITYIGKDSLVHTIPDSKPLDLLEKNLRSFSRSYKNITVPVLAMFAEFFLQTDSKDEAVVTKFSDWNTSYISSWKKQTIDKLKAELKDVKIIELPALCNTSIGVAELDTLSLAIINFINKQ
jgi:pimeloyl-ACP methyl ester carboxylesterase